MRLVQFTDIGDKAGRSRAAQSDGVTHQNAQDLDTGVDSSQGSNTQGSNTEGSETEGSEIRPNAGQHAPLDISEGQKKSGNVIHLPGAHTSGERIAGDQLLQNLRAAVAATPFFPERAAYVSESGQASQFQAPSYEADVVSYLLSAPRHVPGSEDFIKARLSMQARVVGVLRREGSEGELERYLQSGAIDPQWFGLPRITAHDIPVAAFPRTDSFESSVSAVLVNYFKRFERDFSAAENKQIVDRLANLSLFCSWLDDTLQERMHTGSKDARARLISELLVDDPVTEAAFDASKQDVEFLLRMENFKDKARSRSMNSQ